MPSKPPKVVFDTNIFISAIIFGGNPRTCLELARQGEIKLYISSLLLLELAGKLREKFDFSEEDIDNILVGISVFSEMTSPTTEISLIKSDPDDNRILEIAKEVEADYVISGDKKHILPLKEFGKTKIVDAADFLKKEL
jgi:putative PIN family toxin of toxin-antitoxin system